MIELFDAGGIPDALEKRCPIEAAYIRQFAEVPTQDLIRNVATTVRALALNEALMPITIDSPRQRNCYVVSPTSAYTDYAQFELQLLPQPFVRIGLKAFIAAFGCWSRRVGLDRIVPVNNWMLSANLSPSWDAECLIDITVAMREHYPDRAIAFRSLNAFSNDALLEQATRCGYLLLPSRQIYIQDARQDNGRRFSKRRDFKHDFTLSSMGMHSVARRSAGADLERWGAWLGIQVLRCSGGPGWGPRKTFPRPLVDVCERVVFRVWSMRWRRKRQEEVFLFPDFSRGFGQNVRKSGGTSAGAGS